MCCGEPLAAVQGRFHICPFMCLLGYAQTPASRPLPPLTVALGTGRTGLSRRASRLIWGSGNGLWEGREVSSCLSPATGRNMLKLGSLNGRNLLFLRLLVSAGFSSAPRGVGIGQLGARLGPGCPDGLTHECGALVVTIRPAAQVTSLHVAVLGQWSWHFPAWCWLPGGWRWASPSP